MSIPYWPTPWLPPPAPNPIGGRQLKYRWVVKGWNCPVCTLMANRVATYQQWTIRPGFHTNCDCRLVPVSVDTPTTLFNFFGVDQYLYGNSLEAFYDYLFNKGWNWLGRWSEELLRLAAEKGDLYAAIEAMRPVIEFESPQTYLYPPWMKWEPGYQENIFNLRLPGAIVQHPKINWLSLNNSMYGNTPAMMRNYRLPSATLPWQQVQRQK